MKTLFIWKHVEHATTNWHTEAGVLVIADSLETAREKLRAHVPPSCEAFTRDPDVVASLALLPEAEVFIFPDSGCC